MGLFDFLRGRRERESALPPSASVTPPSAQVGEPPVVGQQVAGLGGQAFDLGTALSGGFQVAQGAQSIDMSNVEGLRGEIFEIMRRHGIDPETGVTESVDASAMPQMQQEIVEALSRHGLDLGGGS